MSVQNQLDFEGIEQVPMKDFAEMNTVWDNWIPEGHAPARACVEARMARPDLLVEISVIAAVKS